VGDYVEGDKLAKDLPSWEEKLRYKYRTDVLKLLEASFHEFFAMMSNGPWEDYHWSSKCFHLDDDSQNDKDEQQHTKEEHLHELECNSK